MRLIGVRTVSHGIGAFWRNLDVGWVRTVAVGHCGLVLLKAAAEIDAHGAPACRFAGLSPDGRARRTGGLAGVAVHTHRVRPSGACGAIMSKGQIVRVGRGSPGREQALELGGGRSTARIESTQDRRGYSRMAQGAGAWCRAPCSRSGQSALAILRRRPATCPLASERLAGGNAALLNCWRFVVDENSARDRE